MQCSTLLLGFASALAANGAAHFNFGFFFGNGSPPVFFLAPLG
jgi:hypothetical protein